MQDSNFVLLVVVDVDISTVFREFNARQLETTADPKGPLGFINVAGLEEKASLQNVLSVQNVLNYKMSEKFC